MKISKRELKSSWDFVPACPLCGRLIPKEIETDHHLIPVLKGGRHGEKVPMHSICHSKIHSVLTESELANVYNTVAKLLEHPEIIKFVKWVQKKPIDFNDSNKEHKRLKR